MKANLLGPLCASLAGLLMLTCAVESEAPRAVGGRRHAPPVAIAQSPAPTTPTLAAVRAEMRGSASGASRSCDCYATGDMNQSGVVTAADAQMIFTIVLGLLQPSPAQLCAADCDGSGVITAADAQHVFGVTLGVETCPSGLPDGACCESDAACAAGRCSNGFCCAAGDCCTTAADCPAGYSAAPRCDEPESCQGTAVVAVCLAGVCGSSTVADDSACGPEAGAQGCGFYADVACTGQPEQSPPQCAESCAGAADCDPGVSCQAGLCHWLCRIRVASQASAPEPDGFSWETAYSDIQSGVNAARTLVDAGAPRCEVWVAEGVYAPLLSDQFTLALQPQVDVYGGFLGTEDELAERDWQINDTLLTGLGQARHVVIGADDALLDGFIITGGDASGSDFPHDSGGGLLNLGTSPSVQNCAFVGNAAVHFGGGLFTRGGAPQLTNCTFYGNSAQSGAGLFSLDAALRVTATTFSNNVASGSGGAVHSALGAPSFTGCSFSGNVAETGGGLYSYASSPTVLNGGFRENEAAFGGAMASAMGGTPNVTNCTFAFNHATQRGGALLSDGSSLNVTNCSFSYNVAFAAGGALYAESSETAFPWVTNAILWNDTPEEIVAAGFPVLVRYSDVQGGYPGQAVLDADPLYADVCVGDLHLLAESPCRDRADGHVAPLYDAEGQARCDDPGADDEGFGDPAYGDLGAYEYQHPDCQTARAAPSAPARLSVGPPEGPAWAGLSQKCR